MTTKLDLPDIFSAEVAEKVIHRFLNLTPNTIPGWGKMNAAQMLAHCNVPYEMVYDDTHTKPNFFMRFILSQLVKKYVVTAIPYKKSSPTAPAFIIKGERDFGEERERLIKFIHKTQQEGAQAFDMKESNSFGKLTINEWNNMFYKHLDHHLTQFGA